MAAIPSQGCPLLMAQPMNAATPTDATRKDPQLHPRLAGHLTSLTVNYSSADPGADRSGDTHSRQYRQER